MTHSPHLNLTTVSHPVGTTVTVTWVLVVLPVVHVTFVHFLRKAALLIGTHITLTPTLGTIARALLGVVRVLVTALSLIARRSWSLHVRSRDLRVLSRWPL